MSRPFALDPLFQSTRAVAGVGPRIAKLLERVAGEKVADLLWTLPHNVIDRRHTPKIAEAHPGEIASITVRVEQHSPPKTRNLPWRVRCTDETGYMDLIFFHVKGDYLEKQLPHGETRIVSGKVEMFHGTPQMAHPDFILPIEYKDDILKLEPIYPLTAGLTQKTAQKVITAAQDRIPELPEWHDPALLKREHWLPFHDALHAAHHPQEITELDPMHSIRQRLAYDEILANQLTIALVRQQQTKQKGRALMGDESIYQKALSALPFTLTNAQMRAIEEIREDMQDADRMLRLLQGDVGSGKTAVAFLAASQAIASGGQVVIMAPTEILARQHEKNISEYAAKAGFTVTTLTGRDKGKTRTAILEQLIDGSADIVIGTHALFQDDVDFKDLALVIIDEQHRFGVHQRLKLSDKGNMADILVMTATPIPRTLTLTAYGDMEVSRLDEKPAGRQPIDTRLVSNERLGEMIDALTRKISEGERIYWVCPLVEESEKLDLAAAEERFRDLESRYGARVGLLHGRMKPKDKDAVMSAFANGELDILVATTVIEVGVDVPEATVMIIEHAERFGLAQLHQLRGRIGRGSKKSVCILMYNPHTNPIARERLKTIRDTEDGFIISEKDLELRGAGEVLGTRQSGLPGFRLASMELHGDLIKMAHDDARLTLEKDPNLLSARGKALRTLLYLFERDTAIKYLRSG